MKTLIPIVALSFLIAVFVDSSYAADVKDKHQEFLKREAEVNNVKPSELKKSRSEALSGRTRKPNQSSQQDRVPCKKPKRKLD